MKSILRVSALWLASALILVVGPTSADAQKALVYCPAIDQSGCSAVRTALTSAFAGGVDAGDDGANGTVDLRTVDLFQYAVIVVPSLAETDSAAPYARLRDPGVADRLKLALLGRRAFWSGTPDQGSLSSTRAQKDALIRNLAAWASADFGTVNAPGLVVLQDNSEDVSQRYSWVQALTGFQIVADPRLVSYSSVRSITAAGNAVLSDAGSTLAYANMASMGFQTPSGASGVSMDAVGQTGTSVGGQIVLVTQMGANTGGAVVKTDTDDYPPGTPVIMTGSGFQGGETVTLTLHEDPLLHPDRTYSTTADASGAFEYSGFAPEDHDLDVRFVLTAKGQSSGRQAQTTFTDGISAVASAAAFFTVTGPVATPSCTATGTTSIQLGSRVCASATLTTNNGVQSNNFVEFHWFKPNQSTATFIQRFPASGGMPMNQSTVASSIQTPDVAGTWTVKVCNQSTACGQSPQNTLSTATIVVNGVQNQTVSFTSTPPANAIYGGSYTPSATASSGLAVTFGASGACTISSGIVTFTNVGSCTVTADQAGNASFNPATQQTQTFAVAARAITVTADAQSKTYGDADPTLTYSITSGSLVSGDALSGALARTAGTAVGNYAILQGNLSAGSNYALSFAGANLAITPRAITVTADAATKGYGDVDPALTYQVTTGALVGGDALTGALARVAGENVGTYAIQQGTLSAGGNYTLSFSGANLTIGPRAVTVTADAKTKGYGDPDPALTYSVTAGSLVGTDAFTGSLTRAAGEGVGSYAIGQGTLAIGTNYTVSFAGASLSITARAVTVTPDAKTKVYGDADPSLTYQITAGSLVNGDAFSGALGRAAGENVGSYSIGQGTLALTANYALTVAAANLSITPRPITIAAAAASKTYGDADPALTYQLSSGTLIGTDALTGTLTRTAGENVGDYDILQGTVTAGANYTVTFTGAKLTIGARQIGITADAKSKVYGDADPALTYQITSGSLVSGDAFTGSLARATGEDVGAHAITVGTLTAGGNYSVSFTSANLTITPRSITVTADAATKVYGEADPVFGYQVTTGSLVAGDAFTGALARSGGQAVGSHPITQGTLALSANYALSYVGANLSITPRPITVTADGTSKVYGNADPTFTAQVTTGSLVFGDGLSGALSRDAGEDVGSYTIRQGTLSAGTNYTLSYVTGTLAITPRPVTVTADAKTKVYGNADPALTYQLTGSLAFSDAFTGALARASGENVGDYAIGQGSLALTANYTLTFAGANLTITTRPVTATADPQTKVYGDADPALTYQVTSGSLVNGDAFSGSLTRAAGENVGSYGIQQGTLSLSGNYALTYAGANLSITARSVTVTADPQTKVYGNADPSFTYQLTAGTLVNGDGFSGALTRAAGENVGAYAIQQGTLALSANYALGFVSANLSITPRPIGIAADAKTKVYGDGDPALTYQLTSGTLVTGDAITGALSRATGESVGSYAITQGTLTAGTNYTIGFTGANLGITPRPITVTADAKTKTYGNVDPALTAQVTSGSLAFSDALSGSLSRAAGENVGSYAIAQGSLTAGTNYTLSYQGANLSITPRSITLKPQAPDLVWTGLPLSPSYSLAVAAGSLGNGDATTAFTGGTYSPLSVTDVGTYAPTVLGLVNPNYAINTVAGSFKVLDQSTPTGTITELNPVPLNGTPVIKVNFNDAATGNSRIVEWQYRIDAAAYGTSTITVPSPSSNANVSAQVAVPTNVTDVVQICVQGKDEGGNWSPETCALLAIYDPSTGFVTGGGWIDSPAGAYVADPALKGKANFGFVSKYQKGASVPSGNTEFQFKEGNLNFKSTSFSWLVIQGGTMAQFKGTGTINGAGSYQFLVTAIDGDAFSGVKKADAFRIKITNGSTLVYDNKWTASETDPDATALGGGSIQIQSK